MKLLSLPIVAILSSCATNWYYMGQEHRLKALHNDTDTKGGRNEDEEANRLRVALKKTQERLLKLEARLAEAVEAPGGGASDESTAKGQEEDVDDVSIDLGVGDDLATGGSDPFGDLADAVVRLQSMVQDMGSFGCDALSAYIWPWPLDSAAAAGGASAAAAAAAQQQQPSGLQLFVAQATDAATSAHESVHGAATAAHAQLPLGVQEQLRDLDMTVRDCVKDYIASARAGVAAGVAAFLERHPQHRTSLELRDPLFVAGIFLAGAFVFAFDAYVCLKIICWTFFKILCLLFAPCGCSRRSKPDESSSGAGARSEPSSKKSSTTPPSSSSAAPAPAAKSGGGKKETVQEAVSRLRAELGGDDARIVCILGGTKFQGKDSEALVQAIASKLATSAGANATFVTGGMTGVQECFAKHCGDGSRVRNLLPVGQSSGYGRGTDINAGADLDQRKAIFGLLGDVYLTVEGGPGVSQEASAAYARGAAVVPLMRTGGASSGLMDFPKGALQRPNFAKEKEWNLLSNAEAPVAKSAAAAAAIVAALVGPSSRHGSPEKSPGSPPASAGAAERERSAAAKAAARELPFQ